MPAKRGDFLCIDLYSSGMLVHFDVVTPLHNSSLFLKLSFHCSNQSYLAQSSARNSYCLEFYFITSIIIYMQNFLESNWLKRSAIYFKLHMRAVPNRKTKAETENESQKSKMSVIGSENLFLFLVFLDFKLKKECEFNNQNTRRV